MNENAFNRIEKDLRAEEGIANELQSRGITYGLKLSLERLDDKGIDAVAAFGEYVF